MKKRRAQKAKYQRKIDRACQWVKTKLIQAIHDTWCEEHRPGFQNTVPRCAECDSFGSKLNPLCPDHINGKKWHVRSANQMTRLLRYISEFLAGVKLRILCKKCNEKDGAKQRARGHRVVHHSKVPLPSSPRFITVPTVAGIALKFAIHGPEREMQLALDAYASTSEHVVVLTWITAWQGVSAEA